MPGARRRDTVPAVTSLTARLGRGPALALLFAAAHVAACQTAPPPPRALTIRAQRGQSQAQQDRDNAACQSTASAAANSSESWAFIFSDCMTRRGYLVQ